MLTSRELEILPHLSLGLLNKEIGRKMGLSPLTVKNHVQKLLRKMGAKNRTHAVYEAFKRGWLTVPKKDEAMQAVAVIPVTSEVPKVYQGMEGVKFYSGFRVMFDGKKVILWPLDYDTLHFLVQGHYTPHSREAILNAVWGDADVYERTVDTHIRRIRIALRGIGYGIKTARSEGYQFIRYSP